MRQRQPQRGRRGALRGGDAGHIVAADAGSDHGVEFLAAGPKMVGIAPFRAGDVTGTAQFDPEFY